MHRLFILISLLLVIGCSTESNMETILKDSQFKDYGNGVYYTELTGKEFCIALSKFKETHYVYIIVPQGLGLYGHTNGHILVCKSID